MIWKKIAQLKNKLALERRNVWPFVVSLLITLTFILGTHYLGNYFTSTMWIFNAVLLGTLLSIIMLIAGFAVLKALFFVAAELSLLIYLAQSYCEIPSRLPASDDALKSLLVVGILYIVISFFRSLYETIKNNYKKLEDEKWAWEKILTVSLYLFFTFLFIWQVYRVMEPILSNLCVYRR
jgi:hypothetical protein